KKKDSKKESTDKSKTEDKATDKVKPVKVDYANINNRIIALPIPAGAYNFNGNVENTLLYVRNGSLIAFDLNKLEEKTLVDKLGSYAVSADGKQMLYSTRQGYYIVNAGQKPAGESGKLKMDNIKLQVDPAAEWNQIFNEVWAMQKEFFYVENMHGADWNAVKAKYEKYLPYVNHRSDLGYLLNEMMGELVVGHAYIYPGDQPSSPSVSTGTLGADLAEEDGAYKITKIFSRLDWNPSFKAPLAEPGLNIKEGNYIVGIDGVALTKDQNIYKLLEQKVG